MSLRYYIGGAGSGKSTRLYKDIINRSLKEPEREFLIIVPDQFTMQTQKEIVEIHPRNGIMNIDVQSFTRLAERVENEVGGLKRKILDDTGKNLILRKVASSLMAELPSIGPFLKKQGYIHEVKSVISEFMQYGLSAEDVDRLALYADAKPVLSGKLKDINRLYKSFGEYLGDHYITKEEKLDVLAQNLMKSTRLKGCVVALDGFTGFTPVQLHVIASLMRLQAEVIVTVILPPKEYQKGFSDICEQSLFYLSATTVRSLDQLAVENGCERGADVFLSEDPVERYAACPVLGHLEQNLFREDKEEPLDADVSEHLEIFAAKDPREEMAIVCRKIRDLTMTEGYGYHEIAVVTGDIERYAPYARECFDRYGIPCFLDQSHRLEQNPFVEYIRSALLVVTHGFTYENVMQFLRTQMTGIDQMQIDRLDNYLYATGLQGEKFWKRDFARRTDRMKQLDRSSKESEEIRPSMALLRSLNDTRKRIMEILDPLIAGRDCTKPEELGKAIYRFCADQDLNGKMRDIAAYFKEAGDRAKELEYSQIYKKIMELLEQMVELLEGEEMEIGEFAEIFFAGIGEIKVGIIPLDVDRVVIGDMERTRLKKIRALFFVGCNDGVIPKGNGNGGMISDMDREFLKDSGYTLSPTPRQKMFIQRLYLYYVMCRPTQKLILSFAETDQEGKAIRPSYLIETVRSLYTDLPIQTLSTEQGADTIYTKEDERLCLAQLLREYAGRTLTEDKKALFYTLYAENKDRAQTEILRDAAFCQYIAEPLSRQAVKNLYGDRLPVSISSLERFAACAFSHFLSYGLSLKEREDSTVSSLDVGNLYHGILERFGRLLKNKGMEWDALDLTTLEVLLKQAEDAEIALQDPDKIYLDARTSYALERIHRILLRSISVTAKQLSKGKFKPERYEETFLENLDTDSELKVVIRGKIDRMDLFESDDRVYVKVVDYKSGQRKLDLSMVYYGLQLQLPVYMEYAKRCIEKYMEEKKDARKEVVTAAAFYSRLSDPIVKLEGSREDEQDDVFERILKELRWTGVILNEDEVVKGLDGDIGQKSDVICVTVNKDGSFSKNSETFSEDDLKTLVEYADHKVKELAGRIGVGDKILKPCGDNACDYCSYRDVCGLDSKIPGYEKQDVDIKGSEALQRMRDVLSEKKDEE